MYFPNYKDGSIVNLMSSIGGSFRAKLPYTPLPQLLPLELAASTNIVLFVIDGLGYEMLLKYAQGSILFDNIRAKLTSVFPSTTAACMTTFLTGVAPQQHAITGWLMYLRELGDTIVLLRGMTRSGASFEDINIKASDIVTAQPFAEKLNAPSFLIKGDDILGSDYTQTLGKGSKKIGYKKLQGLFTATRKAIKSNTKRKYIHSYWPELDTLCHEHGVGSGTVSRHIKQFVKQFEKFVKSIEGTKTTIIITADHGLIDVGTRQRIEVKKHTGFAQTLTLPMSGEARAEYCYVRPDKVRDFEAYVQRHFAHVCTMYRSEDIIRQGLFGLGTPHEKLKDRIGDYVLVMKENYIIKDFVLGEEEKFRKAYHGGVSKEEMFVPLVVIKTE